MYNVKYEHYPNNEVRYTLTKVRSTRVSPETHETEAENPVDRHSGIPALDIGCEFEESSEPVARKETKFGVNAKRSLLRCGAALERHAGSPSDVIFMTGTLPGSTPAARQAIADYAHVVVHYLKNWLDYYRDNALDFYVWERQKNGALHLHYAAYIPDYNKAEDVIRRFKKQWCSLLDMVGKLGNCNMYKRGFGDCRVHDKSVVQAYAQRVRKSVAAYLAKYCGKGSNSAKVYTSRYFPKRWWGTSRPLKTLMASMSEVLHIAFDSLEKGITYVRNCTDAISPAARVQYEYQHKNSVGMTTVTYYLEALWKAMTSSKPGPQTELLTPLQKVHAHESCLIVRLNHLTANFYRYSKFSIFRTTPTFDSLLNSAKHRQLTALDADFGNIRAWVRDILALSSSLTTGKLARHLPFQEVESHRLMMLSLWRLEESKIYHGRKGWSCLEHCDAFLKRFDATKESPIVEVFSPPTVTDPAIVPENRVQLSVLS